MRKLRKKGQTEDFVADLIPSLIIIAIGLYVLSGMNDVNKGMANEISLKLATSMRGEEKAIADYLAEEINAGDKHVRLSELISLSHKNEEYKQKVKEGLKSIQGREAPYDPALPLGIICLNAELNYPDDSGPLMVKDELCMGEEKILRFPTYEGEHITMKLTLSKRSDISRLSGAT